jgi:4-hydroxythreonine-4-phosphate dehydrogenase
MQNIYRANFPCYAGVNEPRGGGMDGKKPAIAMAMGDPAGISPEIAARLLALPAVRDAAEVFIFGDLRVLEAGARVAGVRLDIDVASGPEPSPRHGGKPLLFDLKTLDPETIETGKASEAGGRFALRNFREALHYAAKGHAGAVFFTPFNKAAMRLAHPSYDDEIIFIREVLNHAGAASEFNVLEGLWNARVTSHIPLAKVAASISTEAILRGLTLTDASMRASGFARPRIAVAALNPHAGDGGNFGREEIDVIEPAVRTAAARGLAVEGPFPADTVFLRAKGGQFDAVLTMYHDQGQIAMKLMGFDRGSTLIGGFAFAICTPAHGTAYDIAGKGIANVGASEQALLLAARMASRQPAARQMAG